jgi:hypothetical protein
MEKEKSMTLQQKSLNVAITQLGKHETPLGSNWGSPVQDYLKSVNIGLHGVWHLFIGALSRCLKETTH